MITNCYWEFGWERWKYREIITWYKEKFFLLYSNSSLERKAKLKICCHNRGHLLQLYLDFSAKNEKGKGKKWNDFWGDINFYCVRIFLPKSLWNGFGFCEKNWVFSWLFTLGKVSSIFSLNSISVSGRQKNTPTLLPIFLFSDTSL